MNDGSGLREKADTPENQKWFEVIWKYYRELFNYALWLTKEEPHWSSDLVQTTFVKALKAKNKPDPEDQRQVRFWLRKILRNEFLNQYEQLKRTASIDYPTLLYGKAPSSTIPTASDIIEALRALLEEGEKIKRVPHLLSAGFSDEILFIFSQLDAKTLHVVFLANYLGFSLKEIAERNNENYNTVKSRYYRFHQKWWIPLRVITRLRSTNEYRQMHRILHQEWVRMCYTIIDFAHNNCYKEVSDKFERADLLCTLVQASIDRALRDILHFEKDSYRLYRVRYQYILDYLIQMVYQLSRNP